MLFFFSVRYPAKIIRYGTLETRKKSLKIWAVSWYSGSADFFCQRKRFKNDTKTVHKRRSFWNAIAVFRNV